MATQRLLGLRFEKRKVECSPLYNSPVDALENEIEIVFDIPKLYI
jgi:hypothetical protein